MVNGKPGSEKFYGKYRGIVTDNRDPNCLGRIRARVRTVLEGKELGWAFPCVPYAGQNVGILFIPPVGSDVWIEFEAGDITKPIFAGCFWNSYPVPNLNNDSDIKIIKTEHFTMTVNDKKGEKKIEIKTEKNDQKVVIKPDEIELFHDGCSVKLTSREVSINGKNLKVKK
jgi:uncharacterized protein involved in type VI secretion and phage assembly